MTFRNYERHLYNLLENIYPMKILKCPLCDKEWNDLKVMKDKDVYIGLKLPFDTLAIVKEHIFDHLKEDLDYTQWSMPKLDCFTKKNVMLKNQNPNVLGWVYNCSMCKKVLFEGITEEIAKEKALKHLSLCPLKTFNPTKKAIMDLGKSTDSHDILRTYIQRNGRFNATFNNNLYFDDDYQETWLMCRDEGIRLPVYVVAQCDHK